MSLAGPGASFPAWIQVYEFIERSCSSQSSQLSLSRARARVRCLRWYYELPVTSVLGRRRARRLDFAASDCVSFGLSDLIARERLLLIQLRGKRRRVERKSHFVRRHLRRICTRSCTNQLGREQDRPQARFAAPRPYAEHVRAACATSAEVSFSERDTIQRPRDGRHQTLGAECGGVTPAPTCRRHQSCLCCIMLHLGGLRSLLRTAC